MPLEDKAASRMVEREIAKHMIDSHMLTVHVINHICYIGGTVSRLQGTLGREADPKSEIMKIADAVRLIKGINDVVVDARVV